MRTHDSLGRRLPTTIEPTDQRIDLNERDLALFEAINVHGPLYSSFLSAYSQFFRKSEKRFRERLTLLANNGYLTKPREQYASFYIPRNQQLLYDLTPKSKAALIAQSRYHDIAHTDQFMHRAMRSAITASIHLSVIQAGYTFLPQDELVQSPSVTVPFVSGQKTEGTLIPDALFAVDYGTKRRWFALEADRATEPLNPSKYHAKNMTDCFKKYREFIGNKLYHDAYQTNDALLVLFVTVDEGRKRALQKALLDLTGGKGNNYILFKVWEGFSPHGYRPPKPNPDLFTTPWERVLREPLNLSQI